MGRLAVTVALVGAWIAFWFTRLDIRTLQLIRAGEDVLEAFQARLAKSTNIPALEILKAVENPSFGASLYKTVIGVIEWTIVVVFIVAAAYAGFVGKLAEPTIVLRFMSALPQKRTSLGHRGKLVYFYLG